MAKSLPGQLAASLVIIFCSGLNWGQHKGDTIKALAPTKESPFCAAASSAQEDLAPEARRQLSSCTNTVEERRASRRGTFCKGAPRNCSFLPMPTSAPHHHAWATELHPSQPNLLTYMAGAGACARTHTCASGLSLLELSKGQPLPLEKKRCEVRSTSLRTRTSQISEEKLLPQDHKPQNNCPHRVTPCWHTCKRTKVQSNDVTGRSPGSFP